MALPVSDNIHAGATVAEVEAIFGWSGATWRFARHAFRRST